MDVTPDNKQLQKELIPSTEEQLTGSSQLKGGLHQTLQLFTGTTVYQSRFNPNHIQISAPEAAEILGISIEELNNRRRSDKRCPIGFIEPKHWMAPMRFRLSDIYAYSEVIMKTSIPATTDPNVNKAY